jgi:hypothetical protein
MTNYQLDILVFIVSFAFFLTISLVLSVKYSRSSKEVGADEERRFSSSVEEMRRSFEQKAKKLVDDQVSKIADSIEDTLESQVHQRVDDQFSNAVINSLGEKFAERTSEHATREVLVKEISGSFQRSLDRIGALGDSARSSASIFKFIGLILATLGVFVSAAEVVRFFQTSRGAGQTGDWTELVLHIPHILPFILLSEVLAFVMFRYHSRSLEQMRYYANEVSTLDIRRAACIVIIKTASLEDLRGFADGILKTERNTILKKDERTIELGQNQGEDAYSQSMATMIVEKLKPVVNASQKGGAGNGASPPGG